ncbi:MAG TPA: hypothetical protein VJM50_03850 [Pyrinomonadaceae bacterium]|nr:hypothetical protein [Pyrinomonadaceae bacterium]
MANSKTSKKLDAQLKAFRFLTAHLQSQETFTKEEFKRETGWITGSTFDTYWRKQFKSFVEPIGKGRYHVRETFRPYMTWQKFRQHVTQVRQVVSDYSPLIFENVLIYEFFLPLTNEAHLRTTLDSLFYKDRIVARLKTIGVPALRSHLPVRDAESEPAYIERIVALIERTFVGYSIFHVNGRFRAEPLSDQDQVAKIQKEGRRYLIDETTAVAKFIFPCKDKLEADQTQYLFEALFVRSIIQLVNGEEEIWMVESGLRNRVHVWRVTDEEVLLFK